MVIWRGEHEGKKSKRVTQQSRLSVEGKGGKKTGFKNVSKVKRELPVSASGCVPGMCPFSFVLRDQPINDSHK